MGGRTTMLNAVLFETIPCPLCGDSRFEVVKPSKYAENVNENELRQAYSASSNHHLLDQVVRCESCSLHYVNPRPLPELIIDSYSAAEDETFVAQNEGRIRGFKRTLGGVLKRKGMRSGSGLRFLDIGCAGGASLVAAKSLGFQPVGVEPSRWMADFGRRTYGVEIHDGILEPGMFPPSSFDFITMWDVLEHVPDPGALLRLVHELLTPNGTFVMTYPDFKGLVGRMLGDKWPFWLSVHLLYYDRRTIVRQLDACGFQTDALMPYWPVLELGYIFQRAAVYVPPANWLRTLAKAAGLDRILVAFNMSQTVVIAHKGKG
ncbi:MAG TPA: class I SAM-dependent methyltransferase [Bryobacteraceae bacterium]|nr:class I SAM-dependent methyltransferase [Bryobacteraceae bacterium]